MMPRKGFLTRAHQLAALTEVIHDRKIDPRIPDWLDDILSKKRLSRLEDANLKGAQLWNVKWVDDNDSKGSIKLMNMNFSIYLSK